MEPLTPVQVERKLIQLINDLGRAQQALAAARDDEVDAHHEYKREYNKTVLSGNSPKVERGGYTVGDKTAWVERQCQDLEFAADKAKVIREAAQDRLRVMLAQAELVRSLGASVRLAYENAGVAA